MLSDPKNIQIDKKGKLSHLLGIEELSREQIIKILDIAETFLDKSGKVIKPPPLSHKTAANLFFENSTRTRSTFELAEKNLGIQTLNLNINHSSAQKGESLLDTIRNLEAMGVNVFVIRHPASGAAYFVAQHVKPGVAVINAGDGCHEHPTQALLDMFTIRRHKKDFSQLCVTIIGDVLHSRVARSQILALDTLGVSHIRAVAPNTLLPAAVESLGVSVYHDLETALEDADVVIALRLQHERMTSSLLASQQEFFDYFGLTKEKLAYAKPDAIVMHPGPMNRGVEISSEIADGQQSVILDQVNFGIAVRMAVLDKLMKQ